MPGENNLQQPNRINLHSFQIRERGSDCYLSEGFLEWVVDDPVVE